MERRRPVGWASVVALALCLLSACAPPGRGALAARFWPTPTAVPSPAPGGASMAQYYTLSAFRVADRLASASNAMDDGLTDWGDGRISDSYLQLVAQRSTTAAHEAMSDADQLAPPPGLSNQAAAFNAAADALTGALDATQQALSSPLSSRDASLRTATAQRQAAAQQLDGAMSALLAAGWGRVATR